MTFEETLTALQGMLGRKVTVAISAGAPGTPQVTVASIAGRLARAMNRGPAVIPADDAGVDEWNKHDAQFFVVGESSETGFYLSPQAFHAARWVTEGQSLWIEHGPDVVIGVVGELR